MRKLALYAAIFAASPAAAQDIELPPGTELEVRTDGDLNGDGVKDIAFIAGNQNSRSLTVLLSTRHEVDVEFTPETLELEVTQFTPATLALDGDVLKVEDLTGGTTVLYSNRPTRPGGQTHDPQKQTDRP